MDSNKQLLMTPSLHNLERLADSLVESKKTRLDSKDPVLISAFCALCAWIFVVETRSTHAMNSDISDEYNNIVPPWIHQMGASCLLAALFSHILQVYTEMEPFRRILLILVSFINGASGMFYALFSLNLVPVVKGWRGMYVVPLQWLHYMMTAPVMIYVVSHLSPISTKRTFILVAMTWLNIVVGIMGQLPYPFDLPPPLEEAIRCALIGTAVLLFLGVMWGVHGIFAASRAHLRSIHVTRAPPGAPKNRQTRLYEHTMRCMWGQEAIFVLSWMTMPSAFFLTLFGRLTPAQSALFWTLGDMSTKILFTSVALTSNYLAIETSIQLARMSELEAIIQKEAFIGRVSHELRTPLNGIIGLSENMVMNPGTLDAKQVKFLSTIRNSGYQLLTLINDILDTAAFKSGSIMIQHQKVNLEDLIVSAIDILGNQVKPGVSLSHEISPTLPIITGDNSRISRILNNLISNALKFTSKGTVRVTAEALAGNLIKIEVRDTGVGILPAKLHRLFDGDYPNRAGGGGGGGGGAVGGLTGDGTPGLSRPGGSVWNSDGSGPGQWPLSSMGGRPSAGLVLTNEAPSTKSVRLGLSMTKRLVEAHHGTILVASEIGVGSTFTVILPTRQPGDFESMHGFEGGN